MSANLERSGADVAMPSTAADAAAVLPRTAAFAALFAALLGLLAGQRFLLPIVSAFICLVPLVLAMLFWRKPAVRNSMTCLALLSKVDSSSIAYVETPGSIRLIIYGLALWALFAGFRISAGRLSAFLCYVAVLLAMTFLTKGAIDDYSLARDVIALLGVVAVLGTTGPEDEKVVDVEPIAWFSLGLLGAELANLAYFFDPSRGDYLSYDSLKGAVVFASLYMLLKGRLLAFFVLSAAAMFVLVGYATRMLLITYALVAVLLLFSKVVRGNVKVFILGTLCAGVAVVAFVLPREVIEGNRLFGMVYALAQAADWLDYLRILDPVRYVEHAVFLSRPPVEILLGSGLGSGFIDVTGEFSFVRSGTGAFSDQELLAGQYFRLHDAWIYFGLRLGLVFVLLAYCYFAAATLNKSRDTALLGGFGLILLNSATFSISGLLMTMLIAKQIALAWRQKVRGAAT
jgi:hypothetical protein